jgi:hypothetical protein
VGIGEQPRWEIEFNLRGANICPAGCTVVTVRLQSDDWRLKVGQQAGPRRRVICGRLCLSATVTITPVNGFNQNISNVVSAYGRASPSYA